MEQLKRCPFCGNIAYVSVSRKLNAWGYYVACVRCVAKTDYYVAVEAAIAAWNSRKPMERILERLKESREMSVNINSDKAYVKAIEIVKEEM